MDNNLRRKEILIVDNSGEIKNSLTPLLEERYKVFCAKDAKEALNILKNRRIDLILLEMFIPGINGFELTKMIKKEYPFIYIIIITGYGSKEAVVKAFRNHVDDYFDKPFDMNEIILRIKYLLGDNEDRIERIKELVENSYGNQTLDILSKKIYLNPKYMSRIFKEKTGEKFIKYRRDVRLNYAKYLIENTEERIDEIANKVGYQHSASLIRVFKEEIGYTPKQYKKIRIKDS